VLAINPRAAVAANNLAWKYASSGKNLDEALSLAQTAVKVLPNDPDVNDTLGWITFKRGDAPRSLQYFETSLRGKSHDPEIEFRAGFAYAQAGQWTKARPLLKEAVASAPNHPSSAEARKLLQQIGE